MSDDTLAKKLLQENIKASEKRLTQKSEEAPSFWYILPLIKDKKVLDAGCGTGIYLRHFSRESIGIDIVEENYTSL